jgi:ferredoxin
MSIFFSFFNISRKQKITNKYLYIAINLNKKYSIYLKKLKNNKIIPYIYNDIENKNISKFYFSTIEKKIFENSEKVKFTFHHLNGKPDVEVEAPIGKNILKVAHDYNIELEGACDCSLACSTCHVILDERVYEKIGEAKEEEEDLLDLAFGLTQTSRLGCQVKVSKLLEGTKITIPSESRNLK